MRRLLFLVLVCGCEVNNPTYFTGTKPFLEVNADATMPVAADNDTVSIVFRAPSSSEQAQLDSDSMRLGFPVPWLKRSDIAIEVAYTIKNLDDKVGTATVTESGANEFTNYDTAVIQAALDAQAMAAGMMNPDEVVFPLISGIPVQVPAHGVYQGILREDDFAEAELDLDAIGRWMAVPAAVLINRSEVNPIGLEMVPPTEVVPAMFKIVVSFTADTHMTCEFVVRVRDGTGQLWDGSGAQFTPMPADYTPPAMGT